MSASFVIRLSMFVLLFVGLLLGIFTQQFGLIVPYLCLAPWVGLWFGRATIGAFPRYRITRVSAQDAQPLRQRNMSR